MSEVVEHHQQSQVLAPREGEKLMFELGNIRQFVQLSVGPRHQPLRDESAEPGGGEETELRVEPGGGQTTLQVEIAQLLGQTSLVAAVQRAVVLLEVEVTQEHGKYGDQLPDLRQVVVSLQELSVQTQYCLAEVPD